MDMTSTNIKQIFFSPAMTKCVKVVVITAQYKKKEEKLVQILNFEKKN